MQTRHEKIKSDCTDILDYYYVTTESEFPRPTRKESTSMVIRLAKMNPILE